MTKTVTSEDRAKFYDFEKYMHHAPDCPRQGDQQCSCGMAQVRFNLEQLLDELQDEPTCNCFAPRVCPVHGQRYVWPESGEASFAHKPGCAILTAAGNPACSCGALKSS